MEATSEQDLKQLLEEGKISPEEYDQLLFGDEGKISTFICLTCWRCCDMGRI